MIGQSAMQLEGPKVCLRNGVQIAFAFACLQIFHGDAIDFFMLSHTSDAMTFEEASF
jgi:hypothetical protein